MFMFYLEGLISIKKKFKTNHFPLWRSRINPINTPIIILNKIDEIIDRKLNIKNNASKELSKIIFSINKIESNIELKIKLPILNIFNPKILRPTTNTIEGIKNAVIPNQSLIHRLAIYAPNPPMVLLIFLSIIISPRFFPETILSSAFQSKKKEIKAISK